MIPNPRLVVGALFVAVLCRSASTQCEPAWTAHGFRGPLGAVEAATRWDPDGPGPLASRLAVASNFAHVTAIGDVLALDPVSASWTRIGTGMNGDVTALVSLPGGGLVAAGHFTTAGGRAASRIARWDGSQWHPLGSGLSDAATSLAVMPNDDVVVGGLFQTAGGVTVRCIARWNGLAWSPFGTGMTDVVESLTVMQNGDLIAGGTFTSAGGTPANGVARWNGTNWSALGSGMTAAVAPTVFALAQVPGGDLIAAGRFGQAGGVSAPNVARWNGASWQAMGGGVGAIATDLTVQSSGDVIVGGEFTIAGAVPAAFVARWDGASWNALGTGLGSRARALTTLLTGEVIAGGGFETAGGVTARSLASWNGFAWSAVNPPLAAGFDRIVRVVAPLRSGGVVIGGEFAIAAGLNARRVVKNDAGSWSALGAGANQTVHSLLELQNGDILAGGGDGNIIGGYTGGLAQWNGSSWLQLASTNGIVAALVQAPGGDIFAAGYFTIWNGMPANCIVRWNGSAWLPLGSGTSWPITSLALLQNGNLIAGGYFTSAGGAPANYVARWDGASWSPFGVGLNGPVLAVHVMRSGDLIAAGSFTAASGSAATRIARWNGFGWLPLGAGIGSPTQGEVLALAELHNGDVAAAGRFTLAGGSPASHIARWNGSAWSTFGSGASDVVRSLAMLASGELAVGGEFLSAGGQVSPYVVRLVASCPASANPIATSCVGTAGPFVATANTRPWVGSTFRSTASGFGPSSLGVSLLGLTSPNVPLSWVWPNTLPNCNQLASQEAILLHLPQAGSTTYSFAIPNSVAFAGVVLFHQFLQFELTPQGNLGPLSSSNGLQLTIGAF